MEEDAQRYFCGIAMHRKIHKARSSFHDKKIVIARVYPICAGICNFTLSGVQRYDISSVQLVN